LIEKGIKRRESVGPASYGEVRGVLRNDLVRALAHALPLGTLRLGCHILSVKLDETKSFPIVHVKNGEAIKAKARLTTVDIFIDQLLSSAVVEFFSIYFILADSDIYGS
jgi:hypothetical protein